MFVRRFAQFGNIGAIGVGQPAYETESSTLFTAFPTPPTIGEKVSINTCIKALKDASLWAKFSLLYVVGSTASPADNGLINWVSPGTFNLSVGAAGGTFAAYRGYTGDGTSSYLDTVWDPSNNGGGVYQQDDAHLGSYTLVEGVAANADIGNAAAIRDVIRSSHTHNCSVRVNCATAHTIISAGALPKHTVGVRRESTTMFGFEDGAPAGSTAAVSSARSSSDLHIAHFNTTAFSARQTFAVHCGAALSDADVLALYNALHNLAIAVGADT